MENKDCLYNIFLVVFIVFLIVNVLRIYGVIGLDTVIQTNHENLICDWTFGSGGKLKEINCNKINQYPTLA